MNALKGSRTHDKFYLNEDRRNKPKEYFKFITKNIQFDLNHLKIIDIGCATGEFLYYLNKLFPNASLHAADVDLELLNRAKTNCPSIKKFYQLDISKMSKNIGKFDVVFMLGVHSIFDEFNWINSVKSLLKDENSKAYIFGIFNPDDIDVIIRGIKSNSIENWETGWNVFSKASISKYMETNGLDYLFKDFKIDLDIKKNINDPLRSWTINKESKEKLVINGLCLIHYFSLLEIGLNED